MDSVRGRPTGSRCGSRPGGTGLAQVGADDGEASPFHLCREDARTLRFSIAPDHSGFLAGEREEEDEEDEEEAHPATWRTGGWCCVEQNRVPGILDSGWVWLFKNPSLDGQTIIF